MPRYVEVKSWFHQHFICAHDISGEVRAEIKVGTKRYYKYFSKCGRRYYGRKGDTL